jgi:uncharacterized repeat protein (TIGR02543 family)
MRGKSLLGIIVMMLALIFMPAGLIVHAEPGDGNDGGSNESQYTITFFGNCGHFADGQYEKSIKVNAGESIGYVANPVHTYNSNLFLGWYSDESLNNPIDDIESLVPQDDMAIYSNWRATDVDKDAYINVDANGGLFYGTFVIQEGATTGKWYINPGKTFLEIGAPSAYRTGFAFNGWFYDKECTKPVSDIDVIKGNETIYAGWTREYYVVTLDAGEGYFYNNKANSKAIIHTRIGSVEYLPISDGFNNFTDDGKIIEGWYEDKEFTKKAQLVDGYKYYPTNDVTLYAKWEQGAAVTFDYGEAAEAFSGDEYLHTFYIKKGNYVNRYENLDGKSFKEKAFDGWYLDKECEGKLVDSFYDFQVNDGVTFYAKWVDSFAVTYHAGDGTFFGGEETITRRYPKGEYLEIGYTCYNNDSSKAFLGWTPTEGGSYLIEKDEIILDSDRDVYAVYGDGCEITFDANGGTMNYYYEYQNGDSWSGRSVQKNVVTLTYPKNNTIKSYEFFYTADDEMDAPESGKTFLGWSTTQSADDVIDLYSDKLTEKTLNLYAIWTDSYTVTLDANGGHFYWGETKEVYTVIAGKTVDYDPEPKIDNDRIFSGWNTEPDGSGQSYDEVSNYVPTSDITFYAQYEKAILITYKSNGGYFYDTDTDATDTYVEKVRKGKGFFPEGGYIVKHKDDSLGFLGWSTKQNDPDGEYILNYDSMNGYMATENMTLYAVWKHGYKITIHVNTDNATIYHDDKDRTDFTITVAAGDSIYTYTYEPDFVNNDEGLIFDHYNTKADGSGERIQGYYYPKKDMDIYAQYQKSYIITYHATDGYYENISYSNMVSLERKAMAIRHKAGKSVGFRNKVYAPEIDGKKAFLGWSLEENGSILTRIDSLDEDTDVYAVWDNAYEITLDGNGGRILWGYISCSDNMLKNTDSILIGKGKTILAEDEIENVVSRRDGYALRGWSKTPDGSEKVDLHTYAPTDDDTLYAIWKDAISAEFYANGGKIDYGELKKTVLYVDGETVGEFPEVSNGPKIFVEWNTKADGTGDTITKDTPVTDGMKAYAIWENAYRVTFDGNGGWVYDSGKTVQSVDVREGQALNKLVYGYTEKGNKQSSQRFTGWYSDKACTNLVATIDTIEDYIPTSDITLYAGFTDDVVKVTGVSVDKKKVTIGVGDSHKLEVAVKPGNATNNAVIYKSDNEAVATVAEDGTITGRAEGSAKITVTTNDGAFTDTCEVTVDGKNAEQIKNGINGAVTELERQKSNGEVGAMQNTVNESLKSLGSVDSLADKAASNNTVADNLQKLEETYVGAAKITVVDPSKDDKTETALNSVLGDNVNTNNVSVSGAGLNAAPGQTAKVEFEATSEENKMPISDEFTNAMQMDITLKVGDNKSSLNTVEELVAPITIVLPLPRNIKKSVLYVLHFYADGTYELIKPKLVNNTMVITVSHFSTFAFVELADGTAVENNNNNNGGNDDAVNPAGNNTNPAAVIQPTSAAAGTKTTTGNGSYVVSGNYEVKYQASAGKKIKKLSISSSVTIDGQTYKVTSIGKGAVKNCKKLTTLTIPESVVKIEKGAVTGCAKLGKITVNGNTLQTVQKGAFKGTKKGAKVTVYAKDQKTFDKAVSMLKKGGLKNAKFKFKKKK